MPPRALPRNFFLNGFIREITPRDMIISGWHAIRFRQCVRKNINIRADFIEIQTPPEPAVFYRRKSALHCHCLLYTSTDIYAARESNTYGVTSKQLSEKIPQAVYCADDGAVTEFLRQNVGEGDVIVIMGAGNISRLADEITETDAQT